MAVYTIIVPDEHDPGLFAFLDAIEPGASSHTLDHPDTRSGDRHINIDAVRHHRLGVTIRRVLREPSDEELNGPT